jgi:hypothetical protein
MSTINNNTTPRKTEEKATEKATRVSLVDKDTTSSSHVVTAACHFAG